MHTQALRAHARPLLALAASLALIAAGCGGNGSDGNNASTKSATPAPKPQETKAAAAPEAPPEPAPEAPPAAAPPALAPDAEGIIRLTGNDMMQYNAKRIEVTAGSPVKLELKHVGKQPLAVMGHNFVLLKSGSDPLKFAASAVTAKASDYIPADLSPQVIAHTKMVGGGQSDTIEFTVAEAGEYPFLCSFPGHVGLMRGVLVAK